MEMLGDDSDLEFRSTKDDAWYNAQPVLTGGDTLTVKFKDFPETCHDEVFTAGDFATPEAVDEFCRRFRQVSVPLEDGECSRVIEGMPVCAAYKDDGLVRFFDAVVDDVCWKDHSTEKCSCAFMLFWQHGPAEGFITSTAVADICHIDHGPVDSRVAHFRNLAKGIFEKVSSQSSLVSREMSSCRGTAGDTKNLFSPTKTKQSSSQHELQAMERARQFACRVPTPEGREVEKICQQSDQDIEVGGTNDTGSHHYIMIENLEKDLSPSLITEFIHKETSVTSHAYVFPSLSSETYTRGAIVSDRRLKLKRISEFLSNPNHFIVSLTGRPWVVAENILRVGTFATTVGSLLPKSQYEDQNKRRDSGLKVVRSGSEDYTRAKRLKDLFMEFHNHLNGLWRTLGMEEKKLLRLSQAI